LIQTLTTLYSGGAALGRVSGLIFAEGRTRLQGQPGRARSILIELLEEYGYLAVFAGSMLDNVGLPVPGEAVLIIAASAAANTADLSLLVIILLGALGALRSRDEGRSVRGGMRQISDPP
jgi:hypothetical protein